MASSSPVEQAKAGNPQAIAFLLNSNLNPKGIEAKVHATANGLNICLTAEHDLLADSLLDYMRQSFQRLNPIGITQVNLYGQSADQAQPTWCRSFQLRPPSAPSLAIAQNAATSKRPATQPRNRKQILWLWLQWQGVTWMGSLMLVLVSFLLLLAITVFLIMPLSLHEWAFDGFDEITQGQLQLAYGLLMIHGLCALLCGAFVGSSQGFWLKKRLPNLRHWGGWTALGFPLGSFVAVVIHGIGGLFTASTVILFPLWLIAGPILGALAAGAIVGSLQWMVLQNRVPQAVHWLWVTLGSSVVATLVGLITVVSVVGLPWLLSLGSGAWVNPTALLVIIPISTILSWILFHGLTGVKMAYFIYDALDAQKACSNKSRTR